MSPLSLEFYAGPIRSGLLKATFSNIKRELVKRTNETQKAALTPDIVLGVRVV